MERYCRRWGSESCGHLAFMCKMYQHHDLLFLWTSHFKTKHYWGPNMFLPDDAHVLFTVCVNSYWSLVESLPRRVLVIITDSIWMTNKHMVGQESFCAFSVPPAVCCLLSKSGLSQLQLAWNGFVFVAAHVELKSCLLVSLDLRHSGRGQEKIWQLYCPFLDTRFSFFKVLLLTAVFFSSWAFQYEILLEWEKNNWN